MRLNKLLFLAGSSLSIVPAVTAKAQTVEPQQNAASSDASAPSDATAAAIEDIVVTAQRREQRLQDVPITINAISGQQAAASGVTGTSSLQFAAPGLIVNRQANNAAPFIRGIGVSNSDPNSENSVAIYLDGVYQPTPFGNFFEFNNIERVEVLKGPQGTLFGRNSTGGVIQVITRDPSQEFVADFTAGFANYDKVSASAYISGGLTDNLAANIAVIYDRQHDGWGRNLTTGAETFKSRNLGLRGKLLFTPGDRTTIRLAGDYSRVRNGGITGQNLPGSVAPIIGTGYPGRYKTYADENDLGRSRGGGASLNITHDFDALRVVSISSYRESKGAWRFDDDLSAVPLLTIDSRSFAKTFTQELQLLSPRGSKLDWLIGAYFFNHKAGYTGIDVRGLAIDPAFTNPDAGITVVANTRTRSEAIFAQASYPILPDTNITLGARYTWDDVRYQGVTYLMGANIAIDPRQEFKTPTSKPTWRVAVDHRFSSDILAYVTYNRGFKSGTYSVGNGPTGNIPTRPEKLDAYEVGIKSDLFGRLLRLNVAAFHYDYSDIQLVRFINGVVVPFNGPTATIDGAEIELLVRPSSRLSLNGNIGLLHTNIGDFPNAPNAIRLPNGITVDGPASFNAKGNDLPNSPKLTASGGFVYTIPTVSGELTLSGNVYHNDGRYAEVDNRLRDGPYTIVNASLGWLSEGGRYGLRIWGKNLTNAYYYAQIAGLPNLGDLGGPAGPPRTYGVTAELHF